MKLKVGYSPAAAEQLRAMRDREQGARYVGLYEAIVQLLTTVISESDLAFSSQNRLTGSLSSVLRVKKQRLRLFFIASSAKQSAIVLFVGYRKGGHKHDAYAEFERRVRRGEFDQQFADLGIERPKV